MQEATAMQKESPETCPNCGRRMEDGELVLTDWAGVATEHINCPKDAR